MEARVSRLLHTDVVIDASPGDVWITLADFAAFPSWNPFIRKIVGRLEAGARLDVELSPPGSRPVTIHPTVREVQPGRELRWLGHLGVPGLFDGEHCFQIEPLGDGQVRFVQSERSSGVLAPLVLPIVGGSTKRGFEAMNQALKEQVEAKAKRRETQDA